MSENYDTAEKKRGKRKKCYYEFSKDYPGTRYDRNKHSSTGEALETKRKVQKILIALLIVFVFVLSYFVVFTVMNLSREAVPGLDEIGKTTVAEVTTAGKKEDLNEILAKEKSTAPRTTEEETTEAEEYYVEEYQQEEYYQDIEG